MAKSLDNTYFSSEYTNLVDCFNRMSSFHIDEGLKCVNSLLFQPRVAELHFQWKNFLLITQKLLKCEKFFITLDLFEKTPWFGKKEKSSLVGDYTIIITELQLISSRINGEEVSSFFLGKNLKFKDLVTTLCDYIEAKRSLCTFYLRLSQGKHLLTDLVNSVKEIDEKYKYRFQLPIFYQLKKSFQLHITILRYLLECANYVQTLKFISSLCKLEEINELLTDWQGMISFSQAKRAKKSLLRRTLTPNANSFDAPPFYKWLCQFYLFLLSKFSLYFHEVLDKYTPISEKKGLSSKLEIDFYSNFESFRAQTGDTKCIAILYDCHTINTTPPFCFNLNDDIRDHLHVDLRYSMVISCPANLGQYRVDEFNDSINEFNSLDQLSDKMSSSNSSHSGNFFAKKENFTICYVLALDPHFYLCSTHQSQKQTKDLSIQSNLEAIAKLLMTDQMFHTLVALPT